MRGHYRRYIVSLTFHYSNMENVTSTDHLFIDGWSNEPYVYVGLARVVISRDEAARILREARTHAQKPTDTYSVSVKRTHDACVTCKAS